METRWIPPVTSYSCGELKVYCGYRRSSNRPAILETGTKSAPARFLDEEGRKAMSTQLWTREGRRWVGAKTSMGIVGAALAISLAACSGGAGNQSTPTGTAPPAAPSRSGHANGIIGQVSAENSSTWTINAKNGTQYSVNITPQTQFGTRRTPSNAQQFPVGATVRVSGTVNGDTITATRITAPRAHHPASPPPTPSTS
jgi:hypothetical protein